MTRSDFLFAIAVLLLPLLCSEPLLFLRPDLATAATIDKAPAIDADVRRDVARGRARVLVQLRVPDVADAASRDRAIAHAQDVVLARVPAVLVRRYQSVPLLALEIDAAGLSALDGLGDIVTRVDADRPARP